MEINKMKKNILMLAFSLVTIINGQDLMTDVGGKKARGSLVDVTDTHIVFLMQGSTAPSRIPINAIKSIVASDGTIKYSLEEWTKERNTKTAKTTTVPKPKVPLFNPCEDERYLKIKSKPLDDMSDREYDYFNKKDVACSEYKKKLEL